MLSRRRFLRSGTLTTLSVGLALGGGRLAFAQKARHLTTDIQTPEGFQIPNEAQQDALFYYQRTAFDSCVGSTFTTAGASGSVNLTLLKVTGDKLSQRKRRTWIATRATDCYKLWFQASGPLPAFVPIHTLKHPVLGEVDLFLVEQQMDNGLFYEAVINHLL